MALISGCGAGIGEASARLFAEQGATLWLNDVRAPELNRVVDELKQTQGADGGWTDRSQTRPPVSTAFSLLFLIRSTQKTIFTMSQGSLQGGYGLPKDTTDIRVDGTSCYRTTWAGNAPIWNSSNIRYAIEHHLT